jgi:WD40 repeat protein
MRKIVLLLILLSAFSIKGQTLKVFDIDTSAYPIIKAKLLAFNKDSSQILDLSPSNLVLSENGQKRTITKVTCPEHRFPKPMSSILTIDISGSMRGSGLNMAKEAAKIWIERAYLENSECAITSFDNYNYLNQAFTSDRQTLLDAINKISSMNGTDYNAGLIDEPYGSLVVSKSAQFRRIIVFLTDGQPIQAPDVGKIIKEANSQNCIIYSVAINMACPQSLKDISGGTGGMWYENILNEEQAKTIYARILREVEEYEPCTIEWETELVCLNPQISVELTIIPENIKAGIEYTTSSKGTAYLSFNPSSLHFTNIPIGLRKDTTIILRSVNTAFKVIGIESSNKLYDVNPKTFNLGINDSIQLNISFTPADSTYSNTNFEINSDICQFFYTSSASYVKRGQKISTLRLTHPNGGEALLVGSDTVITWEGVPEDAKINIDLSYDNGRTWKTLARNVSGLQYAWKNVQKPISKNCRIRLVQTDSGKSNTHKLLWSSLGYINDIKWSKDGNYIVVANGNVITVYEPGTFRVLSSMSNNSGTINCLSISPDCSQVVSSSSDSTIKIWDLPSGDLLHTISNINCNVQCIAWSPEGTKIAAGLNDNTVRIWNAVDGEEILKIDSFVNYPQSIAWSSDETKIVIGIFDGIVGIYDALTGTEIKKIKAHADKLWCVDWSPDNSKVASCSSDSTIMVWDLNTNKIDHLRGHTKKVNRIQWSGDNKNILSSSSDQTIKIWDIDTKNVINDFKNFPVDINYISWGPDFSVFLTGGAYNGISVINISNGQIELRASGHTYYGMGASLNPDETKIVTAGLDGNLILWDFNSGREINRAFDPYAITSVAWSHDGSRIATGNFKGEVCLWDALTLKKLRTLYWHNDPIRPIIWSPDDRKLISASPDYSIIVWDGSTGEKLHFLNNNAEVYGMSLSSDGRTLVTCGQSLYIKYWDITIGELLNEQLSVHTRYLSDIAFSPDDKSIATTSDDHTMNIWDKESGIVKKNIRCDFSSIAFQWFQDNKRIAYGGASGDLNIGNINIIDIETENLLQTIKGQKRRIWDLKLTSKNDKLISCSDDNTFRIWQIDDFEKQADVSDETFIIGQPMALACDIDMGRVIIGSSKDSVIKAFLSNPGPFHNKIDSIYFLGQEADSFTLMTNNFPISLEPQDSLNFVFRFTPKLEGKNKSVIVILSKTDTIRQTISGYGFLPKVEIINDIIDFGDVLVGSNKDIQSATTFKNTGLDAFKILRFEYGTQNNSDFIVQSDVSKITLNQGDTLKLDLRFKPSKPGSTRCILELYYEGSENPINVELVGCGIIPRPKIFMDRENVKCITDSIILAATDSFLNYKWSTGEETKEIKVWKSGRYSLSAEYYPGFWSYSDTLEIILSKNNFSIASEFNIIDFDTVTSGTLHFKNLIIKNHNENETYLEDVYLSNNIEFSVPLSQLPALVPAQGEFSVSVCLSAMYPGVKYDTLIIKDRCNDHKLYLRGMVIDEEFFGATRCGSQIRLVKKNNGTQSNIMINEPFPNPFSDQTLLSLMSDIEEDIKIELFDSYGNCMMKVFSGTVLPSKFNEYTISSSDLSSGIYYIVINSSDYIDAIPVVLVK